MARNFQEAVDCLEVYGFYLGQLIGRLQKLETTIKEYGKNYSDPKKADNIAILNQNFTVKLSGLGYFAQSAQFRGVNFFNLSQPGQAKSSFFLVSDIDESPVEVILPNFAASDLLPVVELIRHNNQRLTEEWAVRIIRQLAAAAGSLNDFWLENDRLISRMEIRRSLSVLLAEFDDPVKIKDSYLYTMISYLTSAYNFVKALATGESVLSNEEIIGANAYFRELLKDTTILAKAAKYKDRALFDQGNPRYAQSLSGYDLRRPDFSDPELAWLFTFVDDPFFNLASKKDSDGALTILQASIDIINQFIDTPILKL